MLGSALHLLLSGKPRSAGADLREDELLVVAIIVTMVGHRFTACWAASILTVGGFATGLLGSSPWLLASGSSENSGRARTDRTQPIATSLH
jgi:hypothetical protein